MPFKISTKTCYFSISIWLEDAPPDHLNSVHANSNNVTLLHAYINIKKKNSTADQFINFPAKEYENQGFFTGPDPISRPKKTSPANR